VLVPDLNAALERSRAVVSRHPFWQWPNVCRSTARRLSYRHRVRGHRGRLANGPIGSCRKRVDGHAGDDAVAVLLRRRNGLGPRRYDRIHAFATESTNLRARPSGAHASCAATATPWGGHQRDEPVLSPVRDRSRQKLHRYVAQIGTLVRTRPPPACSVAHLARSVR